MKKVLTQKRLQELLVYDPDTGMFIWKSNRNHNARIGEVAGYKNNRGYIVIGVDNFLHLAHRLVFLYMTGSFPKVQVDHINCIKDDNSWNNLRNCSGVDNQYNKELYSNNTSGVKGVTWDKYCDKWKVQLRIKGIPTHIGLFKSLEGAKLAIIEAREKYHKEFANHG